MIGHFLLVLHARSKKLYNHSRTMSFKSRYQPIPLNQVRLTDRFWSQWLTTLRERTLEAEYDQLEKTKRLANFRRAAGKEEGTFEGLYFNDSDVYKWIEACAYSLAAGPHAKIEKMMNDTIDLVADAQLEDGYINCFFQLKHPDLKFRNLYMMHEMYCVGHLYEAAVAHYEVTGSKKLLDVATKSADLIASIFGPGKQRGYCGHEEIELALIKLGKATHRQNYIDLAKWMIEERGKAPSAYLKEFEDEEARALSPHAYEEFKREGYVGEYCQDHAPIRQHNRIVGHAVRAMYLYIGATDMADGAEDPELESALVRIWDNLTTKQMYVTAGIGPAASNEGFTKDYDLPNHSAYAETCATVGLVLWGSKYLQMTGKSDYADIVERALYNGSISGISLSGDQFFYTNRLESRGEHDRVPWFGCACCPPNIARMIGSVSRYALGSLNNELWIHIPIGCEINTEFNGVKTKVEIKSDYPWSGAFEVIVSPEKPVDFALRVRIPDWATDGTFEVENSEEAAEYDEGYAVFKRTWNSGDVLKADLDMTPRWVQSNPKVLENLGRVSLANGPLVYCVEQHDLGVEPQKLIVDIDSEPKVAFDKNLLNGINTITVDGLCEQDDFVDGLYAELGTVSLAQCDAKFIPYYSWCNRGPNHMMVWLRSI
jgi:DUF1680 family protein